MSKLVLTIQYAVTNIGVSFHSSIPQRYADIFQVDVSFYFTSLNNIKKMINRGLNVSIACTISNQNFDEINDLENFFLNIGIKKDCISLNNLIEGKRSITNIEINEQSQIIANPGRVNLNDNVNRLCSAGRSTLVINYDGDIQLCSFLDVSLGNIKNCSLIDIWHKSPVLKYYQLIQENDFKQCSNCDKAQKCKICIAKNLKLTGDILKISPIYCEASRSHSLKEVHL